MFNIKIRNYVENVWKIEQARKLGIPCFLDHQKINRGIWWEVLTDHSLVGELLLEKYKSV